MRAPAGRSHPSTTTRSSPSIAAPGIAFNKVLSGLAPVAGKIRSAAIGGCPTTPSGPDVGPATPQRPSAVVPKCRETLSTESSARSRRPSAGANSETAPPWGKRDQFVCQASPPQFLRRVRRRQGPRRGSRRCAPFSALRGLLEMQGFGVGCLDQYGLPLRRKSITYLKNCRTRFLRVTVGVTAWIGQKRPLERVSWRGVSMVPGRIGFNALASAAGQAHGEFRNGDSMTVAGCVLAATDCYTNPLLIGANASYVRPTSGRMLEFCVRGLREV